MVMYDDDTTLYCNLVDLSEDIINNELTNVSEWLAANKLSLNSNPLFVYGRVESSRVENSVAHGYKYI